MKRLLCLLGRHEIDQERWKGRKMRNKPIWYGRVEKHCVRCGRWL